MCRTAFEFAGVEFIDENGGDANGNIRKLRSRGWLSGLGLDPTHADLRGAARGA